MINYSICSAPVFTAQGENTFTSYTRINQMQANIVKDGRVLAVHEDGDGLQWFYQLEQAMKLGDICLDRVSDGFSGCSVCGGFGNEFEHMMEMALTDYDYRVVLIALNDQRANEIAEAVVRRMQPQARICYAAPNENGTVEDAARILTEMAGKVVLEKQVRIGAADENTIINGREWQEWVNIRIDDRNKKRRVLLVGDSISWGFYDGVRSRISDEVAVDAVQTSADLADPALYRNINLLLDRYGYECIHIGIGGHSSRIDSAPGAYEENTAFVLRYLKTRQPLASILWQNSTICVKNDKKTPDEEVNLSRGVRNRIAEASCKAAGIEVNDLETISRRTDLVRIDHVHYGDYTPFAEAVAELINKEIK